MKGMKHSFLLGAVLSAGLSLAALLPGHALANDFPERPVKLVVPYPPGGGADIFARTMSEALAAELGQSVVVENRPGANGIIGTDAVARSAPDGYTIVLGNIGPNAINQALYPKLPYHTIHSFTPVSLLGYTTHAVAVHPSVPVSNIQELIELARKSPNSLNYASAGLGGSPHLAGELFQQMTGTVMTHVPYQGASPANTDLVAGQVELTFNGLPTLISMIRSGQVKPLAVTGRTRSHLLPDVPTVDESGVQGYDVRTWYGIFSPANTPKPIVDRLNQAFVAILATEKMQEQLVGQGYEVASSTPEEFAELVKNEVARWQKVVEDANVKIE